MDVKEIMAAADQVKEMLDNIAKDKTMFVMAVAMAATLVIVWLIRKIAFKYAWSIAIAAGAVVYIVCVIFGGAALGTEISMGGTIVGMLIAAALALVLQIFLFSLDYTRTQIVQFEDDDYYYYVKAVPKQKSGDIAVKERGRHRDA